MEALVVLIRQADVGPIANDAHGVRDQMGLPVDWQPELVVHELLVEGKVAALADREESEAHMEVIVEARNHAADFAILFIDPERS